ncbi:MAG TPA: hypothetical protein VF545_14355 [Thermoleophilaceae bacterium]|jgi:hypothetical protein
MDRLLHLTPTQISLGLAAAVTLIGYAVFILAPAWDSYGRLWERVAAGFLSLFILASLVGIGIGIGVGVLYVYVNAA